MVGGARRVGAGLPAARSSAGSPTLIGITVNRFSAVTGVGFGISLLNVGSGMIIGLRITVSMLLGGIIAWVIAPVWLADRGCLVEHRATRWTSCCW